MEVSVYYFFHGSFHDVEFFASKSYVHVKHEGPEESIFDPTEAQDCKRDVMQQIYITEEDNILDWINEEGNLLVLPSGKILILWKTIWPVLVELASQLMPSIILNHGTSLNINSNKKLGRCGNQRALYSFERKTTIIIISRVFGTKHKRRC